MKGNFCGRWKNKDEVITIVKMNQTYHCTFEKSNIGIVFQDTLIISAFDEDAQVGGVGVYSPIGDGVANYALWSSTKIAGLLGSGITQKADGKKELCGNYTVDYLVDGKEAGSFALHISAVKDCDIYHLVWYAEDKAVLHGIGLMDGENLAFAWGSRGCSFDFTMLKFCGTEDNLLIKSAVKMDDEKIDMGILLRG